MATVTALFTDVIFFTEVLKDHPNHVKLLQRVAPSIDYRLKRPCESDK